MERTVRIFDTTLRDGEQTPGVHFTPDCKVETAERLAAFGVTAIEAGFPVSSPGDAEAVRRVAQAVRGVEVVALARCCARDIDAAAEAIAPATHPVIHVFLATSDIHLRDKLGMTRTEAVRVIGEMVRYARNRAAEVEFSAEDAARTDPVFLKQCFATAIDAGATRVNAPDTVGCMTPREYGALIGDVVRFVGPEVIVSAHCHDDMSMAVANTVAAVEAGARQVEVTVNGIGERAGNAAVEAVAVALELKGIAHTGIDLAQITELSAHVARVSGVPVAPNRAVVGANAFSHASGIHQHGVLKCAETYGFVPPERVGAGGHRFVVTARSGRAAIVRQARSMGRTLTPTQIQQAYDRVIQTAERIRGVVSDDQVRGIIQQVAGPAAAAQPH